MTCDSSDGANPPRFLYMSREHYACPSEGARGGIWYVYGRVSGGTTRVSTARYGGEAQDGRNGHEVRGADEAACLGL